jgi:hypothetical protein
MNLYGYCGQGPVGWADSEGLWRDFVGGILGGVAGFLIGGPVGAGIGAGIGSALGSAADELDRQMAAGEDIDYGKAGYASAEDAIIGAISGGVGGKCIKLLKRLRVPKGFSHAPHEPRSTYRSRHWK